MKWSVQIELSGTLFMLFAALLLFIYSYIKSLEQQMAVIHLLGFPAFIKFGLLLSKFMIQ